MPRQRARLLRTVIVCVFLGLLIYLFCPGSKELPAQSAQPAAAAVLDFDSPDSTLVVVNKKRPVPADHAPQDLADAGGVPLRAEAAGAYRQMAAEAGAAGVPMSAVSGFRTGAEQDQLYVSYTENFGPEAADAISARPGYSEHQTGLAIDIANPDGTCALESCFAETLAGSWAAANAQHYGFIIRYPAGAEHITGYAHEPWHLRYVGTEHARTMHDAGTTLEEYLGLPAAPGY
ncbi:MULTISPECIES: D-alanyl-D-alanine carboxypeptidase family protein [unclassified Arthrobacter]|uniref:M15 family metallopeptidase n=1 Tax=unclassified Arthrobacter TaxID=235627 RepID=UPI0015E1D726|nr:MULTISPECIES: M15 family metallopeptidase [unclassified Arthrobacter]